jgi:hypothetical protein
MKFAQKIFPLGTFQGQKTDGAYISETLAENLDVMVDTLDKDMTFLGLITGNDCVGNGKTTICTQIGCYLTNKINEKYGLHNTFTSENIVMEGQNLPEKSFNMPKFSVIQLDEGDDMTTHSMKQISMNLKRYFRKCRQLNQILLAILPSFFELPKFYALNRSHFLINVKFQNKFERGLFSFYSPQSKKKLYIYGKKNWDYEAQAPDFSDSFFSSYCFFPDLQGNITRYKAMKLQDMYDDHESSYKITPEEVERNTRMRDFKMIYEKLPIKTLKNLYESFGISRQTAYNWMEDIDKLDKNQCKMPNTNIYNINTTENDDIDGKGAEEPINDEDL